MRVAALAILTVAAVLTAAPVPAQTYDPNYPVCLQTYGIDGGHIDCGFSSLAQCAQSAAGRAAQCIVNPYFAGTQPPARLRRDRRVYRTSRRRRSGVCPMVRSASSCVSNHETTRTLARFSG